MPAYNFQKKFVPLIECGAKRQTIRATGKRRPPQPGDWLYLYSGQRTRHCRLIGKTLCRVVLPIHIDTDTFRILLPADRYDYSRMAALPDDKVHAVALADGFFSTSRFFDFFREKYGKGMDGVLIQWIYPFMGSRTGGPD
jgi:hypothetical protein